MKLIMLTGIVIALVSTAMWCSYREGVKKGRTMISPSVSLSRDAFMKRDAFTIDRFEKNWPAIYRESGQTSRENLMETRWHNWQKYRQGVNASILNTTKVSIEYVNEYGAIPVDATWKHLKTDRMVITFSDDRNFFTFTVEGDAIGTAQPISDIDSH